MGTPVERFRLDNGLGVVLAPNRGAPVVAMQAWVGVGSADEPRRRAGISHVFEHMLFKGTARRRVGEIARDVESAGGEINAWTSFDQTVYHVVLASRYFDTGLDVLSDALQSSSFDPGELERERQVILEEIRQSDDDPMRNVAQALFSTAFVRHPYRHPVIGDARAIGRLRRDDLLEFFRTWYVADNITLVIAGDVEPAEARRHIARRFGRMRSGAGSRRRAREPQQRQSRARVLTQDVSEAYLAIGFRIPPLRHPATAALDVAAIVLGQGESSRLATEVRRRRELVNAAYSYCHALRDTGLFVIGATLRPGNLPAAVEAIGEETFRLGVEEVGRAELEKAQHGIDADTVYQLETAEGMARKLGYYEAVAGDARYEARYLEEVAGVDTAQVQETMATHLSPAAATVAVVVPEEGGPRTARAADALGARLLASLRRGATRARRRYAAPAAARAGELVREELENGLRVLIKRDRSVPMVAMRAVWTGGMRVESRRNNGITNMLASTITRGFGDLGAEDVSHLVDDMAGMLAAFAGRNSFGMRAEWLARTWERGFDLLATCLLEPRFDADEVVRERRQVLEELEARADDPALVAFRAFSEALYRKHPYRMDLLGTPETVAAITPEAIARHYRRTYPISAMTLSVVGDVDPARVMDLMRDRFGRLPRRAAPERAIPEEVFAGRSARSREVTRHLERQQAHLIVGFPGTTLDDPDRYALEVLTTILGGQGGRLFVELRDREALAYRIGAYSLEGLDPGYLAVYLACSPDKLPAAVRGIRRELDRIVSKGVSRAELQRAIRYLIGAHDIALQRRAALAAALAFHEAYGMGHDRYRRYPALVRAVTAADVKRAARRFIDWDTAVTATVLPADEGRPAHTGRRRGPGR